MLISGWENGEIHAWVNGKREFLPIQGSGYHKSPIMLIEFSEKGGRLVTADSVRYFNIYKSVLIQLINNFL
jgi:intraflagellar transport protein 140